MTDQLETVTCRGDGLTLSLVIWRRFRAPMPGLLERTLDINPGLADIGPVLPVGTIFNLPIPTQANKQKRLDVIRLW